MSDLSNAVEKVANSLETKSNKNWLNVFSSLAPFAIAIASLATTIVLSAIDSKEKQDATKTTQMDAVSKVLNYLTDSSDRKNTLGLITLSTYGQDVIATKFMKSGLFSKVTLQRAGMYIALNTKDTSIQTKSKTILNQDK